MKRVYISADIEGIAGVNDWIETISGSPEYTQAASQMTAETAAACRGAIKAGAETIWVKDAHDSGRNIDPNGLPKGVTLIRGWTGSPDMMMAGIHENFDCAICIGYHSEAGTNHSPLAHTINKDKISEIRLNRELISELELNSYTAALYGVPIVFVSGDEGICKKAEAFLPGVITTPVKKGIGDAIISIHPADACFKIEENSKKAILDSACICPTFPDKFELEIRYCHHSDAKKASQFPGAQNNGPLTAVYRCTNFKDLLIAKMFMI